MELSEIYRKVGVVPFLQEIANISIKKKVSSDGWVLFNSPLRDDKKASFSINVETGGWKDFATNETGDFADLVARIQNIEKQQAINLLKEKAGVVESHKFVKTNKLPDKYISYEVMEQWIANFHDETNRIAQKVKLYFVTKKGISDEILKKFRIGMTERNTVIYPFDVDADGNVLKWKEVLYSVNDELHCTKQFIHNSSATVFPYSIANDNNIKNVVLCAGENDTLAFYSFFDNEQFSAITFTTGEGTVPNDAAIYLRNKNVTILYDNDNAGRKAALHTADIIGEYVSKVYIAHWSSNVFVHNLNIKQGYEDEPHKFLIEKIFPDTNKFDMCDYVVLQHLLRAESKYLVEQFYLFLLKAENYIVVRTERNNVYQFFDAQTWAEIRKSEEAKNMYDSNGIIQSKAAKLLAKTCYFASRTHGSKKVFVHYDEENKLWSDIDNEVVGNCIFHLLGERYNAKASRDISHALREYYFISNKNFNLYTHLLNLSNVTYDLNYCRPMEQKREYYFNYKTEYEYHENAKCPAFDSFLRTISMNDLSWIDLFWEIAGFCLTHPYTYQKMFWFYGRGGRNGKGTLIRVMQKLLGSVLSKADISPEKLSGNFFLQNLYGKRLATCGDMPGFWMNVDIIKKLTGGDTVTGAIKHQNDEIEFINTAKLVFAMNRLPILSSAENIDPIKKRVVLLPFDYQIKAEDHSIERAFERELPGIFNKAIEGLKRLRHQKNFTQNTRASDILSRWNTNPVFLFVDEMLTYKHDFENDGLPMIEIFDAYQHWMNNNATASWKNDKHYCQNSWQLSEIIRDYFHISKERIKTVKYIKSNGERTSTSNYVGLQWRNTDIY